MSETYSNLGSWLMKYLGHDANVNRIYKFNEMDADHVAAWSKGGSTSADNCQMLCKTHNRAKGNR